MSERRVGAHGVVVDPPDAKRKTNPVTPYAPGKLRAEADGHLFEITPAAVLRSLAAKGL